MIGRYSSADNGGKQTRRSSEPSPGRRRRPRRRGKTRWNSGSDCGNPRLPRRRMSSEHGRTLPLVAVGDNRIGKLARSDLLGLVARSSPQGCVGASHGAGLDGHNGYGVRPNGHVELKLVSQRRRRRQRGRSVTNQCNVLRRPKRAAEFCLGGAGDQLAANRGNPPAQYNLGILYLP